MRNRNHSGPAPIAQSSFADLLNAVRSGRMPDRRPIRFLLIGLINTIFGFLAYWLLVVVGAPIPAALLLGTVAGVLFNFLSTGSLVFRNLHTRAFLPFVLCYGVVYLVNLGFLILLKPLVHSPVLAQLIAAGPIATLSYRLQSSFVFKAQGSSE